MKMNQIDPSILLFWEMKLNLAAYGLLHIIYAWGQQGMPKGDLENFEDSKKAYEELIETGVLEESKDGRCVYIRYSVFNQTL